MSKKSNLNKKIKPAMIITSVVTVGLMITATWFVFKPAIKKDNPSIDSILTERAKQAEEKTETPLGKAMISKNWVEFDKILSATPDFTLLGDVIRGAFVKNLFNDFTPSDYDELFLRLANTLNSVSPKMYGKIGILVTQFNRLPLPTKNSAAHKMLLSWAKTESTHPFLRKISILKLVTHATNPDASIVKIYLRGFTGETFGMIRPEWIRTASEIRNEPLRKNCIEKLSKLYPSLATDDKPYALTTLAHEPTVETKTLIKYSVQALKEESPLAIEAGFKSITSLLEAKLLNYSQKEKILQRIDAIPSQARTPYLSAKFGEIRKLLAPKN